MTTERRMETNQRFLPERTIEGASRDYWKSRHDSLLEIARLFRSGCSDVLDTGCTDCTFENPHKDHVEKLRLARAKFEAWEKNNA